MVFPCFRARVMSCRQPHLGICVRPGRLRLSTIPLPMDREMGVTIQLHHEGLETVPARAMSENGMARFKGVLMRKRVNCILTMRAARSSVVTHPFP